MQQTVYPICSRAEWKYCPPFSDTKSTRKPFVFNNDLPLAPMNSFLVNISQRNKRSRLVGMWTWTNLLFGYAMANAPRWQHANHLLDKILQNFKNFIEFCCTQRFIIANCGTQFWIFKKFPFPDLNLQKNHHQALNPILKDLVSQQHHQAEYEKGPNVKILNYKITSVGLN